MAHKKKDAGPGYLKAEDMIRDGQWREYTLTISEVIPPDTLKAADGSLIEKPVVCFEQTPKRFIVGAALCKTCIIYATGHADPAKWPGHKITLLATKGNWFGEQDATALRVAMPPKGQARPRIAKKDYGEILTGKPVGLGPAPENTKAKA